MIFRSSCILHECFVSCDGSRQPDIHGSMWCLRAVKCSQPEALLYIPNDDHWSSVALFKFSYEFDYLASIRNAGNYWITHKIYCFH